MYKYNKKLVLEDKTVLYGYGFGANLDISGELSFSTAMYGYQEIITTPAFNEKIITFTYPLIGNVGFNRDDYESITSTVKGIIVRDYCKKPSNFRSDFTLDEILNELGIVGISGIDTRFITKKIRENGTITGKIVNIDVKDDYVFETIEENKVKNVSTNRAFLSSGDGKRVVIIDLGLKTSILKELNKRNCDIIVVPYNTDYKDILRLKPDGILITDGPVEFKYIQNTIKSVKELIGKVPIFGISMGHLIIGIASGLVIDELKCSNSIGNYSVKNLLTGKVNITSKNNLYIINTESIENSEYEIIFQSINDGSCQGIKHKNYPIFSVQFNPEGSPGPNDTKYLFDEFIKMMN